MRASVSTVACVTGLLAGLAACETAADHKAAETAANNKAGAEIARICSLHGAERAAQLKKLKRSSGMDLLCPND